jgi:hypothetical protein
MEKKMKKISAIFLLGLALSFYTGLTYPGAASAAANVSENESAGNRPRSPDLDRGYTAGGHVDQPFGAVRVDRDLYPYHAGDVNQFGDDEAYNSITGHSAIGDLPPIHREDK